MTEGAGYGEFDALMGRVKLALIDLWMKDEGYDLDGEPRVAGRPSARRDARLSVRRIGMSAAPRATSIGAVLALAVGLAACSPPPLEGPDEFDPSTAGIPGQIENLFEYLSEGDVRAAVRMTDFAVDENAADAPLLGDEAYVSLDDRPRLEDVGDPQVSEDGNRAEVSVTYLLGETERTETLDLERIPAQGGVGEHWVFVVDPETAGFDASGALLLPPDTQYRVNGVDVSAAFANLSDTAPRVMAFAGTHPIEITVAGADPATDTITVEVDTLFGTTTADDELRAFASEQGFGG